MNRFLHFVIIFIACCKTYSQDSALWKPINKTTDFSTQKLGDKSGLDHKLLFSLNEIILKQKLINLREKPNKNATVNISIPNSNGLLELFEIQESSNFSLKLQDEYPDIRAYSGTGITDPSASISFSISPNGLQSMVLRGDSYSEFIEPSDKDNSIYIVSTSKNRSKGNLPLTCRTKDIVLNKELVKKTSHLKSNTGVFKTIRLALSCTGEYANYFGGTVAGALAGMNATMTRVNAIFNKDLALKLEIIPNNNLIIYTDASTDPYSNEEEGLKTVSGCTGDCPVNWNKEVQNTITKVIGEENYDIGHLFAASGSAGDAGCIGCVCSPLTNTNSTPIFITGKGSGYTSPSDLKPEGSSFDIDFVAHEMGHQIGANHIFSYKIENTNVSVEPGSGSTIMGYAGITGYDVQEHSDSYFGYASILQIQENLAAISCPINTSINKAPTVNAGINYTIPKSTPFILKGTSSDPDNKSLSYCWEQFDSATDQSNSNSIAYPAKTNGPLFRSIPPSSSPNRYMPALDKVLAGQLTTTWESVSSVDRKLNFTLTLRNNASLGLAQTNTDAMAVTVTTSAGPFIITSQNNSDTNWISGATETINWTVNNTNTLPGSANVNIKLSTDGGLTFPLILASNTPNDGSEQIKVPSVSAIDCRLLIEPVENIYYAVNSLPFTISNSNQTSSCNTYSFKTPFTIPESETYSSLTVDIPSSEQNIVDVNVEIKFSHPYLPDVQIELVNPQGTVVKLFDNFCGASNDKLHLNYDDSGIALSCTMTTLQSVIPAQSLAAFNNTNPEGKWILKIRDSFMGDIGTLESASLSICTKSSSLATSDFDINNFDIYPNPNKGNFNIQFPSNNTNDIKVFVFDLSGKQVFKRVYKNEPKLNKNIQLNDIQTGVYLLKIIDGDKETVKKIVIE